MITAAELLKVGLCLSCIVLHQIDTLDDTGIMLKAAIACCVAVNTAYNTFSQINTNQAVAWNSKGALSCGQYLQESVERSQDYSH